MTNDQMFMGREDLSEQQDNQAEGCDDGQCVEDIVGPGCHRDVETPEVAPVASQETIPLPPQLCQVGRHVPCAQNLKKDVETGEVAV